jgi:hypothetical protein
MRCHSVGCGTASQMRVSNAIAVIRVYDEYAEKL